MSAPPSLSTEPLSPAMLSEIISLLRRGRPLSALALVPDLKTRAPGWLDAKSLTNAARLMDRAGDTQLARQWHRLNFRRHPQDDICFLYRCHDLAAHLGIPRVLRLTEERLKNPGILPKHRADLLTMASGFLAAMRDFERASRLLEQAMQLRPQEPWIMVCHASLLRHMDRRGEALAVCGEALRLLPESGPGMELAAQLLIELNRESEAEELLKHGCSTTETADLRWQLYSFYSERERPGEALYWLAEYERLSPLMPEKARKSLSGNRASLYLLSGDLQAAGEAARASEFPFFGKMAAALDAPAAHAAVRTRLPVGFVRQHHMTCGPATLAALAAYWGKPAAHLEIAEKICYDGTSHYSERTWAREQGMDGREFRITAEVTRALISRGVPFTLVTQWATGAHLQAVIGTDDRAGLLIIRDPGHSHYTEAMLEGFLKDCEPHGPRGMLVVPEDQRARVDGIALPEAELYDMVYAVEAALQRHDRSGAQQCFEHLQKSAPGHRLMWHAQVSLAAYDDNPVKSSEALQALAAMYPEDGATAWRAFRSGRDRRPRAELLEELERRSRDGKSDPAFRTELARVLTEDQRTVRRATRLLHRLLRMNPADAQALTTLAQCRWAERAFDDALELYRLAACAADKNEICAAGYFSACRQLNRAEEGLNFLRRRVQEFGQLSAAPHITLADALRELVRGAEAMQVMQAARALRPEDGDLLLYEARLHSAQGHFGEAEELLAQARERVPPQEWHRQAAGLESARGGVTQCIAHWQEVLRTESVAFDAHASLARLFAQEHGVEQTLTLLADTVAQWPWNMGLARLYVDWLRRAGKPEAERELRRILQHNPADDWAWRELALVLSSRQRHDEAIAAAEEALRLSPSFATSPAIYGSILLAAGRSAEAHAAIRQALTLDVNCGAMHSLMSSAADAAQRMEDIQFLRTELSRQHSGGESVMQFREVAQPLLSQQELTVILREGLDARPDVFETWCAYTEHLLAAQDPAALEAARAMTARFPWAPGSWRLYSQACGPAGMKEERLAALQRAVNIAPQWSLAVRDLAELHEREGRPDAALQEIRRIVRANPLDPANLGVLADMLLRQGQTEEALVVLERAVEVEPGYDWGWRELALQCQKAGTPERVVNAARKITAVRPDEPRSWMVMVETLARLEQWTDAAGEAERALERWPKNTRLHELRALILNAQGQREAAIAACSPPVFAGRPPRELRARRAALLLDAAEYAEAGRSLEELVREEPDYGWPRSLLYDLCRARGDNARCLELSREFFRLEPENAVAAGMLAESLIRAGNSKEAMPAVRRALELDPRYTYAAGKLFDDELDTRNFAAAQEILALMERFQQGPRTWLARARLDLAQDRIEEALRPAMLIIQSDEADAETALHVLSDQWLKLPPAHRARLDQVINASVREGRAKNPGVSVRYAATHNSYNVSGAVGTAAALPVPGAVKNSIVRDLVYSATEEKKHDAALRAIRDHRELFRSTTQLWGAVTYVQLNAGRERELVEWTSDWKSRPDREPWMTANIALALASDCGPAAAAEAWEDVLRSGASNVWAQAAAGLAFTSAIKGRKEEARRHIQNLANAELSPLDRHSIALAKAALAAADAGRGVNSANRRTSSDLLREASNAWPGGGSTSRGKHYRRELEHYIQRNGLDPAFAKIPRSAQGAQSRGGRAGKMEMPSWLYGVLVFFVIGMIRACDSRRNGSSDLKIPEMPQPGAPDYRRMQKIFDDQKRRQEEFEDQFKSKNRTGPRSLLDPPAPERKSPTTGTGFELKY